MTPLERLLGLAIAISAISAILLPALIGFEADRAPSVARPDGGRTHRDAAVRIAEDRPCALLFFGLARSFRDSAFPSIRKNLLDVNPLCDVFAHSYNVSTAMGRSMGEDGSGRVDPHEVYLLLGDMQVSPGLMSRIFFETEDDFQRQRNITYYRKHLPKPSRWKDVQMDNMIRQWHSVEGVWSLMEESEIESSTRYERIGLFRLDLRYVDAIPINNGQECAVVPQIMYKSTIWSGINDRMFYGDREHAKTWATGRFGSVDEYLSWQGGNPNYRDKRGLHSEDFLRWLLVVKSRIQLTTKPFCFHRVRSNGKVLANDCNLLGSKVKKA